jgi:phytoene dehydrogenase-like protein
MNDVILVGGGLTGLAAALYCARAGLKVTVLERSTALGGRARTDWIGGHAFNQGGHALYRRAPAARVLAELEITYAGGRPPSKGLLAIARGALHTLPSGLVSMLATDLFGFGAKVETARTLVSIARIDPEPLRDVTWNDWLARTVTRQDARDALGALARVTTYAHAPERASAGATVAQIRAGIDPGVLYLDGGWQTLVDRLDRAAREAGVTVKSGAHVASITRTDGVFTVATAHDPPLAARSVVLATGPATARRLLRVESLGADLTPLHTACLDVGLAELPRPDRLFALGIDSPTYFSVHSASARLCDGGATIHVMKYLHPDHAHHARDVEGELEGVLDLVQPGWREALSARRFMPNLVAANALVAAGQRRPDVDAAGIDGAYVAGDWVGEGSMLLDAALASARAAAHRVIARAGRAASTDATMAAE